MLNLGVEEFVATLKDRILRGFVGSVLGAGTGGIIAAICMVACILSAIFEKDQGTQDLGLLSLLVVLIALIAGAFWGALFGAILGFCNLSWPLNVLLGVVFGGVLSWYLSHTFHGFPVVLRICCFPLLMGACYFGPRFINRFIIIRQFWSRA